MIDGLKPYKAYKDSGAPWLGQVPEHWSVVRSKRLFSARKELALPDDVQLSATQAYGVIPQEEFERRVGRRVVKISMHLEKRRHVEKDDFVISMRSFQGGLERAWASGAIRSSYVVLKPESSVNISYFAYLFKSHGYIRALQSTADFIRDGQDLNYSNFCSVDLPLPPLDEQVAMGRFLDHSNQRIDRFIRVKKKLIALLNEQKQAIIHRTLACGLNPDVPVRDSGGVGIDKIPHHWKLLRAKQLCTTIVDCKNRTPEHVPGGTFTVVRTTNIRHGRFSLRGSYTTNEKNYIIWTERGAPRVGDVFFTREAPAGEACLVPNLPRLCMGQRMMYLRPKVNELDPKYLVLNIYGPLVRSYIEHACNGSTVGHLRLGQVSSLPILWCPYSEQLRIVEHIDRASRPLDVAIDQATREIELLREYRTRLISDVVTGQLDVREVAKGLPVDEKVEAGMNSGVTIDGAEEDEDIEESEAA